MRNRVLAALLAAITLPSLSNATPWHTFGPRAMAMGGAQVAVPEGPLASYWNPAALGGLYGISGLAVPVGGRAEFTGTVLEGANDVREMVKACEATPGTGACNAANIRNALGKLGQPRNGVMADLGAGLSVKVKKVVVFVNSLTYVGGSPRVDLVNTLPGVGAGTIQRNTSKLVLRGGSFTEIGVGYGREIRETGLVLGGNLKGIVGKIGFYQFPVATEEAGGGSFGDFSQSAKTSFQPGVDLGLLWDMRETWQALPMRPRFALVGRNINGPRFSQPDAAKLAGERSKFPLHGQGRAGFAVSPFKFWHLTADFDLTDNVTEIEGFKSRFISAGTEINVFNREWINIPLRAGLQKNVSEGNSGLTYSLGGGLNFLHVHLDVGGMFSAKRTTIQSQGKTEEVPNNFGGAAQISVLFGGTDKGARDEAPRAAAP